MSSDEKLPPSAVALQHAMQDPAARRALLSEVHHTQLGRYAKAERRPSTRLATKLERIARTVGLEIPANGWFS